MASNKNQDSTNYILYFDADIDRSNLITLIHELEKIKEPSENVNIDLIINSPGGYGEVAFQMARILRCKCKYLRSVVPLYAKSAATLLVLSSDSIAMDHQSELGPLDTQIEHPAENRIISAIDHVGSLEYLAGVALDLAFKIGIKARTEIQLSRKDSIKMGLDFAQEYIKPLVAQLDPSLLYQSQRGLNAVEIYAVRLMVDYMFRGKRNAENLATNISNKLVWGYNTHEFVIDLEEAKELGLVIEDSSQYPHNEFVWNLVLQNIRPPHEDRIKLWHEEEFNEMINRWKEGKTHDENKQKNNG